MECGANLGREPACRYCGTLRPSALASQVVASADFTRGVMNGIFRAKPSTALWLEPWDGPRTALGLFVKTVPNGQASTATIAASDGLYADADVTARCAFRTPHAELSLRLRHGDAGTYNFRVVGGRVVALELMKREPSKPPKLSWLGQSKLAVGRRGIDEAVEVRASTIGSRLSLYVDGRLVMSADDDTHRSGRFLLGVTVHPKEADGIVIKDVEVRVPDPK